MGNNLLNKWKTYTCTYTHTHTHTHIINKNKMVKKMKLADSDPDILAQTGFSMLFPTLENPLNSKEIQAVPPKGNQY